MLNNNQIGEANNNRNNILLRILKFLAVIFTVFAFEMSSTWKSLKDSPEQIMGTLLNLKGMIIGFIGFGLALIAAKEDFNSKKAPQTDNALQADDSASLTFIPSFRSAHDSEQNVQKRQTQNDVTEIGKEERQRKRPA